MPEQWLHIYARDGIVYSHARLQYFPYDRNRVESWEVAHALYDWVLRWKKCPTKTAP